MRISPPFPPLSFSSFPFSSLLFHHRSSKHYAPLLQVQNREKARKIILTDDFSGDPGRVRHHDRRSCRGNNGQRSIPTWNTSADPQKSKNPGARSIFSLDFKTAVRVNHSTSFKQTFEELQLEVLNDVFKITKHAPKRWLGMFRTVERMIRLWHVFRRVYAELGVKFLLDKGDNKKAVL